MDRARLFIPEEVPGPNARLGEKIAALGGGTVGLENAEYLAAQGKKVTVIEMFDDLASDLEGHPRRLLLERLEALSVR